MSTAAELIERTSALLLDFDGPVCSLFAGYPAHSIAEESRAVLVKNMVDLPPSLQHTTDPLDILRWTGVNRPVLLGAVESVQNRAEREAAQSAAPTSHASEVFMRAAESGRPVVIVSNNSEGAIAHYLKEHSLLQYVTAIVGRPQGRPQLMKPNPWPVETGLAILGTTARLCTLIGDSPSDIEAARVAGSFSIGYAKQPSRAGELEGADAVVSSMGCIADALIPRIH